MPFVVEPVVPTTALPRRTVSLAVGVSVAFMLTPGVAASAAPNSESIERQIEVATAQLEVIIEQYNDLREDLRELRARTGRLDKQIDALEQLRQSNDAKVGELAANAYRVSGGHSFGVLFAHPDDLVDSLLLLDRLGRDQRRVVAELTESHDRLAAARRTAVALTERQRAQEQQLTVRRARIESEIARLTRLRESGRGGTDDTPSTPVVRPPDRLAGAAATAVRFAFAQLGKPYRWGASGPNGYDCSGLTSAAWARAGVRLPHNAARQFRAIPSVGRSELRPGDLVFYYRDIHHVGIYVGGGRIIHAPRPGRPVRLDRVDYQPVRGYGRPG